MAQYQVPQFIEVEDKIFGPLTLKQFVYLGGAGGMCLVLFTFLPLYLTVVFSIPVIAFAIGLAFFKVNGRPLIHAVEHAFNYFFGSKLYLWQQQQHAASSTQPAGVKPEALPVPKLSQSKLKDLSWSLNIKDRENGTTKNENFAI